MKKVILATLAALMVAAPVLAAGKHKTKASKAAAPAVSEAAQKEASEIFSSRCVLCHGANGGGDGAAAAGLNPKPRNFHDVAWQKSVTDEHIEKIIKEGGASVGKSPLMPPNPDLASKDEVVRALRTVVRNFGK